MGKPRFSCIASIVNGQTVIRDVRRGQSATAAVAEFFNSLPRFSLAYAVSEIYKGSRPF
jgi:hypothetical protein